jgi:hypothetical protein
MMNDGAISWSDFGTPHPDFPCKTWIDFDCDVFHNSRRGNWKRRWHHDDLVRRPDVPTGSESDGRRLIARRPFGYTCGNPSFDSFSFGTRQSSFIGKRSELWIGMPGGHAPVGNAFRDRR